MSAGSAENCCIGLKVNLSQGAAGLVLMMKSQEQ